MANAPDRDARFTRSKFLRAGQRDSTVYCSREIAAKNLPVPSPNSLYFFFLPPSVQVVLGGSASCREFCGYHDSTSDNIFYAVMPYPDVPGAPAALASLTRSLPPLRTNFAKPSPIPCPARMVRR